MPSLSKGPLWARATVVLSFIGIFAAYWMESIYGGMFCAGIFIIVGSYCAALSA